MKVIGIDISSTEALFCLMQENNEIEYKKFSIKNDDTSSDLKKFYFDIKNMLSAFDTNRIAISKRGNKGKFAASSVSFKLEALIQIASEKEVEIISPQTVAAFVKKNPLTFQTKFNYQQKCAELAFYISCKK
jgi:hypothetical protein